MTRRIAGQTTKLKWTCILAAVAALPILPSLAEAARPAPYKAVVA